MGNGTRARTEIDEGTTRGEGGTDVPTHAGSTAQCHRSHDTYFVSVESDARPPSVSFEEGRQGTASANDGPQTTMSSSQSGPPKPPGTDVEQRREGRRAVKGHSLSPAEYAAGKQEKQREQDGTHKAVENMGWIDTCDMHDQHGTSRVALPSRSSPMSARSGKTTRSSETPTVKAMAAQCSQNISSSLGQLMVGGTQKASRSGATRASDKSKRGQRSARKTRLVKIAKRRKDLVKLWSTEIRQFTRGAKGSKRSSSFRHDASHGRTIPDWRLSHHAGRHRK